MMKRCQFVQAFVSTTGQQPSVNRSLEGGVASTSSGSNSRAQATKPTTTPTAASVANMGRGLGSPRHYLVAALVRHLHLR